jgi:Tol biopolymer transport system component
MKEKLPIISLIISFFSCTCNVNNPIGEFEIDYNYISYDDYRNIYIMKDDGSVSNRIELSQSKDEYYSYARFSDDGCYLLFYRQKSDKGYSLMVYDIIKKELRELIYFGNSGMSLSCQWRPKHNQILFTEYGSISRLNLINPDGSINEIIHGGYASNCDWSPDGEKLLYSSYNQQTENTELFLINFSTNERKQLTQPFSNMIHGNWAPDGKSFIVMGPITTSYDTTVHPHAYEYNIVDNTYKMITSEDLYTLGRYSPQGDKILFSKQFRADSNNYYNDLYVVDLNSKKAVRVNGDQRNVNYAEWSPDGKRILFTAYNRDQYGYNVYLVDADGNNLHLLKQNASNPHWARILKVGK